MNKKVFVLFPDGVGLRNFALTNFKQEGEKQGVDVWYWNITDFSITDSLNFQELKIEDKTTNILTQLYSRVRKRKELNYWTKKFNDEVYQTYKFPLLYNSLRNIVKSSFMSAYIGLGSSEKDIIKLREKIKKTEKGTSKFAYCKNQLQKHKPEMVLCTSQRSTQAIAPLLAAKELGIPTATFIYSWDNVPKAMLVVETDYYYVWSEHMKKELLYYYSFISEDQVKVTGTPQFEPHYDASLVMSKVDFFKKYNLDLEKKYICFSGDDETTSPLDQYYLEDLAKAVRALNKEKYNLGIIYRKCPVDFTDRYNPILENYKDVIVPLAPIWKPIGKNWDQIVPSKDDFQMLVNVCIHTEMVTNVCSSTVFDFVIHDKPCIYYNYEQPQLKKGIRDIGQNYKYVHFRSMPSEDAVVWAKSKTELKSKVQLLLDENVNPVPLTKQWFSRIVGETPSKSSETIWKTISELINA
ncbi:UDP-glycosyltransferase [Winogradskyella sp. PC D3.3]